MNDVIKLDGRFLRYGGIVLNRAHVVEVNIEQGEVWMESGHRHEVPPEILKCWFSDQYDYKQNKDTTR